MSTILCIDDNEPGLAVRKLFLESMGFHVLIAASGPAGLALLSQNSVDGVLLDYRMEGMDGAEVARILRRDYPTLPIVGLTGWSDVPAQFAALVDCVVTKGQPPQQILAALRNAGLTGSKPPASATVRDYIERGRKVEEDAARFLGRRRRERG